MAVAAESREPHAHHQPEEGQASGGRETLFNRQKSLRNLRLHTMSSRSQLAPQNLFAGNSDYADSSPLQTSYAISHEPPPALPPLPASPRWDSPNNNTTNFSFPKSKAALSVPSPSDHHHHLALPTSQLAAPPLSPRGFPPLRPDSSAADIIHEPPPHTITPPGSESEPRASTDTMRSQQNFSRPRKPSLMQTSNTEPSLKSKPSFAPAPLSPPPEGTVDDQMSFPVSRPRGQSSAASSIKSTYTSASAPGQASNADPFDPGRSRLRHATTAPPQSSGLGSHSGGSDGWSPGPFRDMTPWASTDESRSSFRSQYSSAQGTYATERSSVATKYSVATTFNGHDEPSLEDVMGMYEKGFHDDESGQEDDLHQSEEQKEKVMNKRNTRILEMFDKSFTAPPGNAAPSSNLAVPGTGPLVRDSADFFRAEQPPSSPLKESHTPVDDPRDDEVHNDTDADSDKREVNNTTPSPPPPARQASDLTTTTTASSTPSTAPSSVATEVEESGARDRYGFKKANQHISRQQYDSWNVGYEEYLDRRRKKWVAFHKENGLMTDQPNRFPPPSAKTKRFIRKGIPPEWRGAAWFYYAGGPAILAKHSGVYDDLLRRKPRSTDVEAIERDLHRTFPDNIKFKPAEMAHAPNTEPGGPSSSEDGSAELPMITSLRRVLQAFAIYNPRIGYCQSLNFLAGMLLLFMETEEQSFWLLNVITRVYLPGTHETSLEGSKVDLAVLMAAIRDSMPAVWEKIGDEMEGDPNAPRPATSAGSALKKVKSRRFRHAPTKSADRLPPITLCMTAWFMSCFIGTLPVESTLRVWDVFFYEGSKTLFRIALTIFKLGEAEIKAIADPMEMFGVVQAMPRRLIDANALMDACFKRRNGFGHLSQDTIETQRQERRNRAQSEREKEAAATSAGGGDAFAAAAASGTAAATEQVEEKPRRKGTLFGRRKRDS